MSDPLPEYAETHQARTVDAWPMPISGFPFIGYCAHCGAKAFNTTSGPCCVNGHGGYEVRDAPELKPREPSCADYGHPGCPICDAIAAEEERRHNARMSEEPPKKIRRRVAVPGTARPSAEEGRVFEQASEDLERKRAAEATSRELQSEMDKSEEESKKKLVPPPYKPPTLKRGFDAIIVNMFESEFEPDVEFRELQSKLSLGVDRSDRQRVLESIDEAEALCRRAHKLYIIAMDESARYNIQCDLVLGPIWESARAMLQADKEAGKHAKQITDADVRARASVYYPDEFGAQELKKARVAAMVKDFAHLVDMWQSRCASLRAMLDKAR